MFANATTNVGISQRVVATLVASAVLLLTIGLHTARAANLDQISDTLSTSEPSVTSAHTISFDIPASSSGFVDGDTVTLTFDAAFTNVATVVSGDVVVTVDGTPDAVGTFTPGASTISFDGVTAGSGQTVVVAIADGKITNPGTIGSYTIDIDTGTGGDNGQTQIAIVDTVTVSAIVETTFDFTITGLATSTSVNGETTTGSTTATEINFATLTADTPEILGQQLAVSTNAKYGFVVTVEQDGDLQSANGAVIDSFTDGTYVDTPAAWTVPGDDIGDNTTWGHWGLTSDDDLNADEFGSQLYVAASTTPRQIFEHNGPADGLTTNVGTTSVAYKIEITPLQEAADDYSAVLTYIATPTF